MARIALIVVAVAAFALLGAACGNEETKTATPETVVGSAEPPPETAGTDAGTTDGGTTDGGTTDGGTTDGGTTEDGAAEGDPVAGKEVFAAAGCASCHTLADAGAAGTIGPNLDESQPEFELVVDRVTNGSGAMPSFSDQLSGEQIEDVAAYVVQATAG